MRRRDILEALKRLEYRGYDSAGHRHAGGRPHRTPPRAGQAFATRRGAAPRIRCAGRTGIGHTRWATHGAPTEGNAHPHASARVALVHNGIIENFRELRDELIAKGHKFESETDTEVAVHLVTDYLDQGLDPAQAAMAARASV